MTPVELDFETEMVFTAPQEYPEAMLAAMRRLAAQMAGELAREGPVDMARLADSWTFEALDPFEAKVGTNVQYAKHVWLGTAHSAPPWPPWTPIKEWAERKGLPPGPVYFKIATQGIPGNDYVGRAEKTVRDIMTEVIVHNLREYGVID